MESCKLSPHYMGPFEVPSIIHCPSETPCIHTDSPHFPCLSKLVSTVHYPPCICSSSPRIIDDHPAYNIWRLLDVHCRCLEYLMGDLWSQRAFLDSSLPDPGPGIAPTHPMADRRRCNSGLGDCLVNQRQHEVWGAA